MLAASTVSSAAGAARYIRFRSGQSTGWALLEGEKVQPLTSAPWLGVKSSGVALKLAAVQLLAPCQPPKIFAVGLNYRSHLGSRPAPAMPEIFYKPVTCVRDPGAPIVIPAGAQNVHYEGELVLVIGKRLTKASKAEASAGIFGVACGNDVSERDWQNGANKDLQWWRAKGADTFGPVGPALVTGINYNDLLLQTRLNGEVVQKQRTSDLLFDPAAIVSTISQFVTLTPGDLVFTGTPGSTKKMSPGDVVEIDIENIGVLRNPVKAG